jgi:hypothetical protein
VTPRTEHSLFLHEWFFDVFVFCVLDDKIEQRVCIKFCVKLGKSPIETLEMLREAFGERSLSRTAVFEWHSRFKAGRVSVDDNRSGRPCTIKTTENVEKKFDNSSTKTVVEQSMSLQISLGSIMEFVRS